MFPEQTILDQLSRRVQQIHQLVGVHSLARREQNHFVERRDVFQELAEVRSRSHEHRIRYILKDHGEAKRRVGQFLQAAVDQCFIL